MSEQAKALELAAHLDDCASVDFDGVFVPSAAELRRLHSVNAELLEALQNVLPYAEACIGPSHRLNPPSDSVITAARAAISRALGQ